MDKRTIGKLRVRLRIIGGQLWFRRVALGFAIALVLCGTAMAVAFSRYQNLVDRRLKAGVQPAELVLESGQVLPLPDGQGRKRVWLEYEEIPAAMRNAIVAVEDHRFYHHRGVDWIRTVKAAFEGAIHLERPRGTSTLTQQLARNWLLSRERSYQRKASEMFVAWAIERRMSKNEILEFYANEVTLGQQGPYAIAGVAEAAEYFFGKDVHDITVGEAALLAALIQRPSQLNPYHNREGARRRRDLVLRKMYEQGFLSRDELQTALAKPLKLAAPSAREGTAPYFVDLVERSLNEHFSRQDLDWRGLKVETTLDPELQNAAEQAVDAGMKRVDGLLRKHKGPAAQVALVALDPRTGEVKALIGGRSFTKSQLNRVLSRRQPGSTFKPVVYAAALEAGLEGRMPVVSPAHMVEDAPVSIVWRGKLYEPANYDHESHGLVTMREALRRSLNQATVELASETGYGQVAAMAKRLGIDAGASPSAALGSYEVTLMDLARAYAVFANGGQLVQPYLVRSVRTADGEMLFEPQREPVKVLDARVAYMMTSMLEDVMSRGTAAGARGLGFWAPAAGKTGTDDDGWFVGYTPDLVCAVWVGFDDNSNLGLTGASSALPVWAEFMKRAVKKPRPFDMPRGLEVVEIDPESGMLATPYCPTRERELVLAGRSDELRSCEMHLPGVMDRVMNRLVGLWEH